MKCLWTGLFNELKYFERKTEKIFGKARDSLLVQSNFFNLSTFTRNDNPRTFFIVIILVGLRRSFIA